MRNLILIWEDIKIYVVKQKIINELPIIFDYTIESGVWYKYGVQKIDTEDVRSKINQTGMVMRNFNYSFLYQVKIINNSN